VILLYNRLKHGHVLDWLELYLLQNAQWDLTHCRCSSNYTMNFFRGFCASAQCCNLYTSLQILLPPLWHCLNQVIPEGGSVQDILQNPEPSNDLILQEMNHCQSSQPQHLLRPTWSSCLLLAIDACLPSWFQVDGPAVSRATLLKNSHMGMLCNSSTPDFIAPIPLTNWHSAHSCITSSTASVVLCQKKRMVHLFQCPLPNVANFTMNLVHQSSFLLLPWDQQSLGV
jgi:hypothetical protein